MRIDVFGTGWGSFKIAHLSTTGQIGFEMFEFRNAEDQFGPASEIFTHSYEVTYYLGAY